MKENETGNGNAGLYLTGGAKYNKKEMERRESWDMKLAVIFPGIGYHTDKPLLYFGKKLAKEYGYEVAEASYGGFPTDIKGNEEKMRASFFHALAQAKELLKAVDFGQYEELLFISKSIGTAVASAFAKELGLAAKHIYYTPVTASLPMMEQEGIVFHGTGDPWIETEQLIAACKAKGFPLYLTEGGNHSLETGNVRVDLRNLQVIMEQSEAYLKKLSGNPET